jgi:hypothetical protein
MHPLTGNSVGTRKRGPCPSLFAIKSRDAPEPAPSTGSRRPSESITRLLLGRLQDLRAWAVPAMASAGTWKLSSYYRPGSAKIRGTGEEMRLNESK